MNEINIIINKNRRNTPFMFNGVPLPTSASQATPTTKWSTNHRGLNHQGHDFVGLIPPMRERETFDAGKNKYVRIVRASPSCLGCLFMGCKTAKQIPRIAPYGTNSSNKRQEISRRIVVCLILGQGSRAKATTRVSG